MLEGSWLMSVISPSGSSAIRASSSACRENPGQRTIAANISRYCSLTRFSLSFTTPPGVMLRGMWSFRSFLKIELIHDGLA